MPLVADSLRNLSSFMIVSALTIMGLYYGQDVLVPVALAILLAFILTPIVNRLTLAGLPRSLSVSLSMVAAVAVVAISLYAFSSQLLALAQNLDAYKANIVEKVRGVTSGTGGSSALQRAAAAVEQLQHDLMREVGASAADANAAAPAPAITAQETPDRMTAIKDFAAAVGAPIGKALLTILFAFFLLLQHSDLRDRLIRIAGTNNMSSATAAISEAGTRLSTLFLAQAAINGAFGLLVGLALWLIGVPNPVLWGIAAAVMRFVPFIGSPLAALPPLLLAAGGEPGWSMFLMTLALYVIGEPVMGQVVEPLVLGKSAGLSPFAMVIALSLWTLLWGPVGLILAVPITLTIVVLGRYVPGLEFMSVLLGDEDPLTADQRFYNRLLSKDASAAIAEIEDDNEESSLITLTDDVVLPALQLASSDYNLDRLDDKHLTDMRETMNLVSEAFADTGGLQSMSAKTKHATSLIVIPARGPVDKMAADFLATLLTSYTPYSARSTSASGLTAVADAKSSLDKSDDKPAVVIATTGSSDSAQLRLIVNRAAANFPQNPVFVAGLGQRGKAVTIEARDANFQGHWTSFRQLVERLRAPNAEVEIAASAPKSPVQGGSTAGVKVNQIMSRALSPGH